MKKLMIAAAIVCTAVMSQAASVVWKSDYNYVTKDGAVQTAATADAGKFVLVYLGDGTADWDNAKVVNEGTAAYGISMGKAYAKVSGTFIFDYEGDYDNGSIFGVMFQDGEGNLSQLVKVDETPIATEFTISGMSDDRYQGNMLFSSSDYTTNVPEPTSAMLLLLGVAGLALRRRRA